MTQDDDEVPENLENVENLTGDLVQNLKDVPVHETVNPDSEKVNPDPENVDPEVIDIDEGKYEYVDFEIIEDEIFEVIDDDTYDTEFLSSIQFQSPNTQDSDGQDEYPSDVSTDEDDRMVIESATHQWDI